MYTPSWDAYCTLGGKYYACGNGTKFVGCCDYVNSCTSPAGCSAGNLRQTSFDPAKYGTFHDQQCSGGLFYICNTTTPDAFFGCCIVNACANDGCPRAKLAAAYLSDNAAEAADMDPYPPVDGTATSTASTTSNSLPSAPAMTSVAANGKALSTSHTAAIIGGAIGGLVLLCAFVVIAWVVWRHVTRSSEQHNRESGATTCIPLARSRAQSEDLLGKPALTEVVPLAMPYQDYPAVSPVCQNDSNHTPQHLASASSLQPMPPQQHGKYSTGSTTDLNPQYRPYSTFNSRDCEYSVHSQLTSPLSQTNDTSQPMLRSSTLAGIHSRRPLDSQYSGYGIARTYPGPPQELGSGADLDASSHAFAHGVHDIDTDNGDRLEAHKRDVDSKKKHI